MPNSGGSRVLFRTAKIEDSGAVAELIYIAAQSHYTNSGFDLSLGGTRASQLAELRKLTVTKSPSWFHHSHFQVAEVEGKIAAGAAGYERIAADALLCFALLEIGWNPESIAALGHRLEKVFSGFPPEPSGFWTVDHVAVLPDWRGRGLARGCLQATFERGKKQGFAKAKLDVFRGNRAARTLYDSCGFQLSATFDNKALRTVLKRDAIERLILTL
jgi:GNAT superfamily N-acetyltransferase